MSSDALKLLSLVQAAKGKISSLLLNKQKFFCRTETLFYIIMLRANWTFQLIRYVSPLWCPKQGSNYKEGLTPVLSLLTESSRQHREIRRYIKAQVQQLPKNTE